MAYRQPAEIFPPGDVLREELEARGWTQAAFAEMTGCSNQTLNEFLAGTRSTTPDMANRLAVALGTSPELWMKLEANHQTWKAGADSRWRPDSQGER